MHKEISAGVFVNTLSKSSNENILISIVFSCTIKKGKCLRIVDIC